MKKITFLMLACITACSYAQAQQTLPPIISTFGCETDGVWQVLLQQQGAPSTAFIKTSNTSSGKIEVYIP